MHQYLYLNQHVPEHTCMYMYVYVCVCRIICIFAYYFDFNNDLFIINNSLVVGSASRVAAWIGFVPGQIADCDLISATRVQKLRTSVARLGIHLNTTLEYRVGVELSVWFGSQSMNELVPSWDRVARVW